MININLLPPNEIGNLVYHHDPKEIKNLLFVRSLVDTRVSYYASINGGLVIFGANTQKVVTSIEVNIPEKKREIIADFVEPSPKKKANIQLDLINNESLYIDTLVKAYLNRQSSWVYITIGQNDREPSLVSVSKDCVIGMVDRELISLYIKMKA